MTCQVMELFVRMRSAKAAWRETPLNERLSAVSRLTSLIVKEMEEIVALLSEETGRTQTDCLTADVMVTLDALRFYIEKAEECLAPELSKKTEIHRVPFGITAVYSPWNVPLQLGFIPAISALIAGNVVILKPSEHTPRFNGFIRGLINKARLPDGVFEMAEGGAETGAAIIEERPDKLFFTGSTKVGRQIASQAAKHLIPCELELGGKDAAVVMADASIKRAARACVWGAFFNNGQACISIERVYVDTVIFEPFLKAVLQETRKLVRGRDIGPLFGSQAYDKVFQQVEEARADGADCYVTGEHDPPYFSPTVLTNVNNSMRIMREETFGPVLPIMAFHSREEAISLVNDCEYGLNASIFSKQLDQAREIALALETGNVFINDTVINVSNPGLPFSGRKNSGSGVSRGKEGLLAFTQPLSLSIKQTGKSSQLNWFPYSEQGLSFIKTWLRLRHKKKGRGGRL